MDSEHFFLPRALPQPLPANLTFPSYYEFRASACRQRFSLPDSIIHYLIKNINSSASYIKLIKCCKYFFIKNPIIPLSCLHHVDDEWKTCLGETCSIIENDPTRVAIDVETDRTKFIVDFRLSISSTNPDIAASLLPKLCHCRFTILHLVNQKISFNDFQFISKELTSCNLERTTVVDERDKEVPYEMMIANLPNIKDFFVYRRGLDNSYDFSNTVKGLLEVPHFKNIEVIHFCGVSESFDVQLLFQKKEKTTSVVLRYFDEITDEYKDKLQAIADGILEENPADEYVPSLLIFPGQRRLRKLYEFYEKSRLEYYAKKM